MVPLELLIEFEFLAQIVGVRPMHVMEQFVLNPFDGIDSQNECIVFEHRIDVQTVCWNDMDVADGIGGCGYVSVKKKKNYLYNNFQKVISFSHSHLETISVLSTNNTDGPQTRCSINCRRNSGSSTGRSNRSMMCKSFWANFTDNADVSPINRW